MTVFRTLGLVFFIIGVIWCCDVLILKFEFKRLVPRFAIVMIYGALILSIIFSLICLILR